MQQFAIGLGLVHTACHGANCAQHYGHYYYPFRGSINGVTTTYNVNQTPDDPGFFFCQEER
jgi:hypothetical protein